MTFTVGRAINAPSPLSGYYYITASPGGTATSNALGVGTIRAYPWIVERDTAITRLGAGISTIGEAGSKLRLGIYADDGSGRPGNLVVDGGTINGDSATAQEVTVAAPLARGLYWCTSVVQVVTTTQPTVYTLLGSWTPPVDILYGTSAPPAAGTVTALSATGVTGALPSTFPAGLSPTTTAARMFVKVA